MRLTFMIILVVLPEGDGRETQDSRASMLYLSHCVMLSVVPPPLPDAAQMWVLCSNITTLFIYKLPHLWYSVIATEK